MAHLVEEDGVQGEHHEEDRAEDQRAVEHGAFEERERPLERK